MKVASGENPPVASSSRSQTARSFSLRTGSRAACAFDLGQLAVWNEQIHQAGRRTER